LRTPRKHFNEDIDRAHDMIRLSKSMDNEAAGERLVHDVRLSAVALAVGAMDAYFSDAYVDCLTSVLRAYIHGKWQGDLPPAYAKRELPAREVLDSSRQNRPLWSLRMATRTIMERDNMLSIARISDQFNGILPPTQKLWVGLINKLIAIDSKRFTGTTPSELSQLSGKDLEKKKKKAIYLFQERIKNTVQFRHDWAHNCGRPKSAIQKLTYNQAAARVQEIRTLVEAFDDHIQANRLAQ
jgi:hypothetical protein